MLHSHKLRESHELGAGTEADRTPGQTGAGERLPRNKDDIGGLADRHLASSRERWREQFHHVSHVNAVVVLFASSVVVTSRQGRRFR